jgi:two-component sensor histidine kinase
LAVSDIDTFLGVADARALAQAMVDTVIDPMVVLDHELRVVTASRSFYLAFEVDRQETQGRRLGELGEGGWDIAELHGLLDRLLREQGRLDGFEVHREFPRLGLRTMILAARVVYYESGGPPSILLQFQDVTDRRILERRLEDLLEQKDVLLKELQHRVANSLAIIASILMLKARSVQNDETRQHLSDAHDRVMSLAAVQEHLHATGRAGSVDVAPYLEKLSAALAKSMTGTDSGVVIVVVAGAGAFSSSHAVSLGLIVTELVINALKHAFVGARAAGRIEVAYEMKGEAWALTVSDNGSGIVAKPPVGRRARSGLGGSIVDALAHQLQATVATATGTNGTSVTVRHA